MEYRNFKQIYLSPAQKGARRFNIVFFTFIFIICYSLLLFSAIFYSAEVVGSSMQPTLNPVLTQHDIVYASSCFGYKKGDIVLVDLPDNSNEGIKRLIALGGDTLSFDSSKDKIYMNGELFVEDYVKKNNAKCVQNFKNLIFKHATANDLAGCDVFIDGEVYSLTLKEGYCIYLGDNRETSYDCSSFGPQKVENVLAKVFIIVPYGYNLFTYINHLIFG